MSGKEVSRILEQQGFLIVRQTASHPILQKQLAYKRVTVPVPEHSTLHTGTLLSIIGQSTLLKSLFEY